MLAIGDSALLHVSDAGGAPCTMTLNWHGFWCVELTDPTLVLRLTAQRADPFFVRIVCSGRDGDSHLVFFEAYGAVHEVRLPVPAAGVVRIVTHAASGRCRWCCLRECHGWVVGPCQWDATAHVAYRVRT